MLILISMDHRGRLAVVSQLQNYTTRYLFVLPSRPASVNFQIYHVTFIIVASCCFSFCRSDWFNADFMVTLQKKLTSAKFVWRAFKVVMG